MLNPCILCRERLKQKNCQSLMLQFNEGLQSHRHIKTFKKQLEKT